MAPAPLTPIDYATKILRLVLPNGPAVSSVRPLHGGMVNRVEEWITGGDLPSLVAKISAQSDDPAFARERKALEYFASQTHFPVPLAYGLVPHVRDTVGTWLLMQRLPGRNLEQARISKAGVIVFQEELTQHVADLHEVKRNTYGPAAEGGGYVRWLDHFGPAIESEFRAVRSLLCPHGQSVVQRILDHLPEYLPEFSQPTLVHGDLWATNILVDDSAPDKPRITGFIDGSAEFAEVEYELAYLRVFHTADSDSFLAYSRRHALRPGFDARCRIYWLNTLMLHIRLFGTTYLARCEKVIEELNLLF